MRKSVAESLWSSLRSRIEVANLTQRFGARLAVDRLSLSIPPGMFYGIVGPNGAGKTTALTAMCGLRRPTAGSVRSPVTICAPRGRPRSRSSAS